LGLRQEKQQVVAALATLKDSAEIEAGWELTEAAVVRCMKPSQPGAKQARIPANDVSSQAYFNHGCTVSKVLTDAILVLKPHLWGVGFAYPKLRAF